MTNISPGHPRDMPIGDSNLILDYWEAGCGSQFAPMWSRDFSLEDLPTVVIPNLAVVDVLDDGRDYLYRFWGSNNTNRKGYEMSGKLLTSTPQPASIKLGFEQFGWILQEKRPMALAFHSYYGVKSLSNQITYRFPLSSDGTSVDKIVSYQPLNLDPKSWEKLFENLRTANDTKS
ncbi:MAG: hypothetical protein WD075_08170 [Rhodospirillales bacterium]